MRVTKGLLTGLLAMILISALYGQNHSETTGDIIWSLGPEDPRIDLRFGTKGLNIGGSEMAACIIKNNFQEELLLKLRFTITDFCGQRAVFTTPEVKLVSHATYAPNPFFEGFTYSTGCKETAEYGRSKKSKTKIQRVDFETVFIKDLTAEKKKAEAERMRKEAEDMKRLEEARKAREEAKAEKVKADAAEKMRKERELKTQQVREARERQATQGASGARESTQSTGAGSSSITKANVADYIYAQEQAKEQAKLRAEEEEKTRKQEHYEAQMAELKRAEEARIAEAQRIENLAQRHIQHANDVDNYRDKAWQLEQAQRLENDHNDIARMEREYEQKLADLQVAMREMEEARRQEWSSRVNTADWRGADGTGDPAVGELVQATGEFINMLGVQSREREAKAALDRERTNFLARVEAEKAKMRFDLRRKMMSAEFPAAGIPIGREYLPNTIYGFYILFNNSDLGAVKSKVVVSNVIEIGTYADGTWPSSLFLTLSDQKTKASYDEFYFHSKKYASYKEALQRQKAFKDFFSRDGAVTEINFDAHLNPHGARMDFWETKVE